MQPGVGRSSILIARWYCSGMGKTMTPERYATHLRANRERKRAARRAEALAKGSSRGGMTRMGLIPAQTSDHIRARKREQGERARCRARTKPWSLRRITREIKMVNTKISKIDNALCAKWQPWHDDRCGTLKSWSEKSPDNYAEYMRARWKVSTHRRIQRIGTFCGHFTTGEWHERMKSMGYACVYCGLARVVARGQGHDLEADHIIPVSTKNAPPWCNQIINIAPACKRCNSSKADRLPLDWDGYLPGRNKFTDRHINAVMVMFDAHVSLLSDVGGGR